MPKIVELKTDDKGQVWANLGRIGTAQGSVMVLTEEEFNNARLRERQRIIDIMTHVVHSPEAHEDLQYAKSS